jgi:glycosyltransferase involved in cell wall biosynthesis
VKVAHLIHSLGSGGAESVLEHLAPAARAASIDIIVVALSDAADNRTAVRLRRAGVTVHELHRRRYDPSAVITLARLLRSARVEVVHTHLKHADVVGGVAAALVGRPAVSTLHVIEAAPVGRRARARVRLAAVTRERLMRATIVLSRAQRQWYAASAPRSTTLTTVPNGVCEPAPRRPRDAVRSELGVDPGEVLALTVSLMRPEKGHHDLLEALRGIPLDVPLVVALAGDGELEVEVRDRVGADPLLRDRVRVLGYRDDVDDLLAACDLVIHPSREDALPTALVSAIASRRAVVATDVGGVADIVGEGVGVLVPSSDPQALAAAVTALVANPQQRAQLGDRGRVRYEQDFSATVWAGRLRRVYAGALQPPPTSARRSARTAEGRLSTAPAPPPPRRSR